MSHYYFDLWECGSHIVDEEGREADPAELRVLAMKEARQIMAAEVKTGHLCLSCRIEVLGEDRQPVLVLPFEEALTVKGR